MRRVTRDRRFPLEATVTENTNLEDRPVWRSGRRRGSYMLHIKPRKWVLGVATAIVVAGAGALVAIGPGFRSEPPEAQQACQAVADGRYEQAAVLIGLWLRSAPQASEAHWLSGRVAVAMGRIPEAALALNEALALGLAREKLALLQALIASKGGRHAEAEPTLRRAFAAAQVPDRQVDEALARAYLETYDLKRATEILDRWARDFPADATPYLWRAEVHGRTGGDPNAVENDYREALRRDPDLDRARLGLAEELRKTHRTALAAREYQTYLTRAPDDPAALLGAGRNLMEHGDEKGATVLLERVIAVDSKNAEPLRELAGAAGRRGDWPGALALLDRAVAVDPYDVAIRQSRGLVLMRLGQLDRARDEQATAARLRSDLDRLHAARNRLIDAPGDRPSQLEIARWMFGHAHDQEGARWAQKILADAPGDAEASALLADYHQRRGETGLANFYRLRAPTSSPMSDVATQER
jgi:tetratricopeptide (TPR) repeat protein